MPGRRTENPGRKKCLCLSTCPHCRSGNNRSPALQQKSGHLLSWSHLPFTHSQLCNRKEAVYKEITRAKGCSSGSLVNCNGIVHPFVIAHGANPPWKHILGGGSRS